MPRTRTDDEGPDPIDTAVGARVKTRRLILGFSQEELATAIGLTFQQVQKYEKGTNRISVSRLAHISRALKVPLDYFTAGHGYGRLMRGVSDNKQAALEQDPVMQRDVAELIRAYSSIKTPGLKKQLLEMAKAMASSYTNK